MKYPNLNIFVAWFFIIQTLLMAGLGAIGNFVLRLLGLNLPEGSVPGRIVGALLLLLAVYLVWYFRRGLPPEGKPEGKGYRFGHKLLLWGTALAGILFVFQLVESGITGYNTHMVLDKVTTACGYLAMGCYSLGLAFIYQSSLPESN